MHTPSFKRGAAADMHRSDRGGRVWCPVFNRYIPRRKRRQLQYFSAVSELQGPGDLNYIPQDQWLKIAWENAAPGYYLCSGGHK